MFHQTRVTSVAAALRSTEHALSGQDHVQLGKAGNSQRLSCNCLILRLRLQQTRRILPHVPTKTQQGPPVSRLAPTEESERCLIRQEVAAAIRTALTPGPSTSQPSSSSHPAYGESVCLGFPRAFPPSFLSRAILYS